MDNEKGTIRKKAVAWAAVGGVLHRCNDHEHNTGLRD